MKNKIKIYFWAVTLIGSCLFTACADMLETDSSRYIDAANKRFDSANDSLYSLVGILKQLQPLGEKYVVLGELRGDLMDVTSRASLNFKAISNFEFADDNSYLSDREYYAVINNCNYYLKNVDTTIVSSGNRVMLGEYAAVKAIRAWVYLQLGLNYGKAIWFEDPILTVDDMNGKVKTEEIAWEPLLKKLLDDITPYAEIEYPKYGNVSDRPFTQLIIPNSLLRSDILLWLGATTGSAFYYEEAAAIYYRLIRENTAAYFLGGGNYLSRYLTVDFQGNTGSYGDMVLADRNETLSLILYDATLEIPTLSKLTLPLTNNDIYYHLKPAQAAIDLWSNEKYFYYVENDREMYYNRGDLRGFCNVYNDGNNEVKGSYSYYTSDSLPYIAKYSKISVSGNNENTWIGNSAFIYRVGTLYLRYAEALNGMGKPSLAFGILKYGLRKEILNDSTKISKDEIPVSPNWYCDFTDDRYSLTGNQTQRGMHRRGSGDIEEDSIYYAFTPETLEENLMYYGFPKSLANKNDSILFVDAMICKELGLESAFEGNRFHDLMRFSIRRGGETFLAKWVGRRNPALESKLMNRNNWFIPAPKK